jgi:HAD superfamily hydrolase (TIGR01484 family)
LISANNIRLIAADIDGTLVVGGKVVSPELKDIFAELKRGGVVTTLCTGRLPHWTARVADELGVTDYLICTEGGNVFHRPTGEKIHYAVLHESVVERVARLVEKERDIGLAAMCDDTIWAMSETAGRRAHWWGFNWRHVRDVREAPEPVLFVLFGPHDRLARANAELRNDLPADRALLYDLEDLGGYAQFRACEPKADKGVGAERLVRHLGGDKGQILAFGDGLNDLGIMRRAGLSICPSNAHPKVCRLAARVFQYSAAEGFVAREIKRIFDL